MHVLLHWGWTALKQSQSTHLLVQCFVMFFGGTDCRLFATCRHTAASSALALLNLLADSELLDTVSNVKLCSCIQNAKIMSLGQCLRLWSAKMAESSRPTGPGCLHFDWCPARRIVALLK